MICINTFSEGSAVDYYKAGNSAYFNENFNEAIYNLKEAINVNPNYYEAIVLLARVYNDVNNYDYAYNLVNKAVKIKSGDVDLDLFMADLEVRLSRFDLAEKRYNRIIAADPLSAGAFNGLANLYFVTDRTVLGMELLSKILKADPSDTRALSKMADYYEDKDRLRAEDFHVKNVTLNSLNPDAFFYYSLFAYRHGEIKKAFDNIKIAIELKKKGIYFDYYGKYLLYLDKADEALVNYKMLIKDNKENYVYFYHLASSYYMMSDNDNAYNSLLKALSLRDDDEIIEEMLSELLVKMYPTEDQRRLSFSQRMYQKAMNFKNESAFDLYLYYLKESIRLYTKNTKARLELSSYYKSLNMTERYINELELIYRYDKSNVIKDKIDMEKDKLSNKLGVAWGLNQYTVLNNVFKVPVFYKKDVKNLHFISEKIYRGILEKIGYDKYNFEIVLPGNEVNNDAGRMDFSAKIGAYIYCVLELSEDDNSVEPVISIYNSANAKLIERFRMYQTGNNRLVLTANSLINKINNIIPFSAKIIKIKGDRAIINAGRRSGIKLKDGFYILKNKRYPLELGRVRMLYTTDDVKGVAYAVKVDENLTEIVYKDDDFYKDINIEDLIIKYNKQ